MVVLAEVKNFDSVNILKSCLVPVSNEVDRIRRLSESTISCVFKVCRFFLPE